MMNLNNMPMATNRFDVYDIAQDKLKTMKICMDNDIPCPKTLTDIKDVEVLRELRLCILLLLTTHWLRSCWI